MQHDKIEPIRSSSKRGFSFAVTLHFFVGGSFTSIESSREFVVAVVLSRISEDRFIKSVEEFGCKSFDIPVVVISAVMLVSFLYEEI